jgi:tetratricopeptide (TPR) repeat protein
VQATVDTAATAQEATPEEGLHETSEPEADPPQAAIEDAPAAATGAAPAPEPAAPAEPPAKVPPVRWDTLQAMAQKAMQQGDPAIAVEWWWLMRIAFPKVFYGYTDAALALANLGRFEEGRRLLDEAATHIQGEPAVPVTRALLEARAGNMDASVDGWRAATALPASTAWICGRLVEALEQQSRHDEVDAVLGQAVHVPRFQNPALLAKAVSVAVGREDWPAVAERLVALGNAAPVDQILAIDLDKILVSLRAGDPAGLTAVVQAPWVGSVIASPQTEPYRLIGQARLAQLCGRLADTMARLAALRPVLPKTTEAYLRVEAILRDAGSFAAADAILAEAKGHFQDDRDVWIRVGDVMEARGDWTGALALWTAMGQTIPGNAYLSHRYQQAALRLRDESPDAEPPEIAETIQPAGESGLRDLALSFESLGGTEFSGGCEFGVIQRAWGAEPLGLFRWATVSPATLIACLEQRFEGIGDEETTELFQSNESSVLLWEIRDERYGFEMHSFIPVAGMERERMILTACNRMRYLTDKLLRDLQNPAKIFVFKSAGRRLEPSEIEGLRRGLAQYPGMRLLCVCPAGADHAADEVETVAPGLMVASMDFSAGHDWTRRTAAWEALCRRVLAEWATVAGL